VTTPEDAGVDAAHVTDATTSNPWYDLSLPTDWRHLMKAVRIHEYGGPEKLIFATDAPDPLMSGESVLVEAAATSVNPIDWKVRSGARQKDFPLTFPAILGKDVSGVVRAVGANVHNFKPGDRVVAMADATYAELVVVDAAVLTHVPEGCDLVDAAALPLIAMTGDQLVRVAVRGQRGQTIVVTGALGSVGRAAVHTARKLGMIVVAGVRGAQLAEAAALGVETLAIDDAEAIGRLAKVDAVADTVGGETAASLFARVKDGGTFGYASGLPAGTAETYPALTVTRVFARPDASKIREFADDVRDGKFVLPISRRMPLREAAEAHVLAERGGAGKIVLLAR
jgi:NADPH:quinone reductase-like Zn-dependent oxidoreductase